MRACNWPGRVGESYWEIHLVFVCPLDSYMAMGGLTKDSNFFNKTLRSVFARKVINSLCGHPCFPIMFIVGKLDCQI